MSVDRLLKWGEGKPFWFVLLARHIASHTEDIIEFTNEVLAGGLVGRLPEPLPTKVMLSLYRDHRRVWKYVSKN